MRKKNFLDSNWFLCLLIAVGFLTIIFLAYFAAKGDTVLAILLLAIIAIAFIFLIAVLEGISRLFKKMMKDS